MSLGATAFGGVVFGLALAAPPGPMNAVIATESVRHGWWAGVRAGLGAMVADLCFFGLALVGLVAVVRRSPTLRSALFVVGGLLMLSFAYEAVEDADLHHVDAGDGDGRGFRKAFALALTNPYQVAFWLTVGVGLLQTGTVDVLAILPVVGPSLTGHVVVRTGHPALVAGLFGGIVVWITAFPAALVAGRRRVERLAPLVAWLSAAVLAVSGLLFLFEGVRTL